MYKKLLQNPILTNLTFLLVLVIGWLTYSQLPREQDPSVNFNWVQIWTAWQGASASDVEKRITDPLEDGIERVPDIKFVSSSSREGVSSILVRFDDLNTEQFDKRLTDLRRELQAKLDELPDEVEQPRVLSISSSNAFPTAIVVVVGLSDDEKLRKAAFNAQRTLERLSNVDRVDATGTGEPELQVTFSPERLVGLGVSPVGLADTVTAYFTDLAAGNLRFGDHNWLVRLEGTNSNPGYLEKLPILTAEGEIPLRSVADIERGREELLKLVRFNGRPAVMLSVFKKDKANNLELLEQVNSYISQRNNFTADTGIELVLVDDQTAVTRNAIRVMENNALIGLGLVLGVTWLFLGAKIAFFTTIGIPFVLAGVFWVLGATGQTLNVTVLLGVVISLGMLVDDAVVVVEAMYFRFHQGLDGVQAATKALQEIMAPVSTAVLTTIAAFLPLMLLPGVLGDFMRVVPVVVSIALLVSLVEAFWILPSHIIESNIDIASPSRVQKLRTKLTFKLRRKYSGFLVKVLKNPKKSVLVCALLPVIVAFILIGGLVRVDFFASDVFRLFYVNVEMPPGTTLEKTMSVLLDIEKKVKEKIEPGEVRSMVSYAGMRLTQKEPLIGEEKGQIFVSLNSKTRELRNVDEMIEDLREVVNSVPGPIHTSFLRRKTGPPTAKPINIKVRGDDITQVRGAATVIEDILENVPGIIDVTNDDSQGRLQLALRLNADSITRVGLDPTDVMRVIRLFVGGEIVASMQYQGEKLNVRVQAKEKQLHDVDAFMKNTMGLPDGSEIPLGALLDYEITHSSSNIKHYNLRRAITIEADLDTGVTDTLSANHDIVKLWEKRMVEFPNIDLNLSGELDDVQQSLNSLALLFLFGVGLIYLILGTQFKSYIQPLLILLTVPMAFVGVVFGLFFSGNSLSLFTLYGVVALAGIAANDAIVLISKANLHMRDGWSVANSIVYAAKRRVLPILITTLTTIAGLLSLALGVGGESLMWGPVATAIIWGLGISTILTLFVIPLGYMFLIKAQNSEGSVVLVPEALPLDSRAFIRRTILQAKKLITPARNSSDKELEKILQSKGKYGLYEEGMDAFKTAKLESAIRCFEELADSEPSIKLLNILAARSHIMYMERNGWDIGYVARAERYLTRAATLDENDHDIARLKKALNQLQES